MKFTNLLRSILVLVPVFLLAAGCGGGHGGNSGPSLVSIAVTAPTLSLPVGSTESLTAIGTYSDNSTKDITTSVTWNSSNNSIATVNAQGVVRGISAGAVSITAASGSISSPPVSLTITAPALLSISVTAATTSLQEGATNTLTAIGNFSNNSTQDLTSGATWSSLAPSIATVNSQGTVTGVSAGLARISATVGSTTGTIDLTITSAATPVTNVMPITVNGSLCDPSTSSDYLNKPCVSVKVCTSADPASCVTVSDVLLDTGSFGLRVFRRALPATLPVPSSGLAECIQFADGSALWGPVQNAFVQLANKPAVQMPIHIVDASFASSGRPSVCRNADATPAVAGFTAILGVGVFTEDCGSGCATATDNGLYFNCTGTSCTGTSVGIENQVPNPVAKLASDNNGVILTLPNVPVLGTGSVNGSLILGIGTQANNTQSPAPTVFPTDSSALITTTFHGTTFGPSSNGGSFIDSGSNGYFIPNIDPVDLPLCTGGNSAWYCPPNTASLTATIAGEAGSPSQPVNFFIANFNTLIGTSNNVFNDLGGTSSFGFDWGLPFFFGRSVSVGFQGVTAPNLGTAGPFVAF